MNAPRRILMADDDRAIRILLSVILTKGGYEIETAANGRELLRRLQLFPADLVLLDLQMPEMNGFGVLAEIRASRQLAHLPVLATSAYGTHKEADVRAAGFDHYFQKPIDRLELLAVIKRFLSPPPPSATV